MCGLAQVAAGQLAAARHQLLQARAAHQELVVRTRQQRATEAALHTTLTAVTGEQEGGGSPGPRREDEGGKGSGQGQNMTSNAEGC